eukprot:jgi/Mesvir1/5685/Mv15700-RA.1
MASRLLRSSGFDRLAFILGGFLLASVIFPAGHAALLGSDAPNNEEFYQRSTEQIVGYWTQGRREGAISRELFLDSKGLAYLFNGTGWTPYGHSQELEETTQVQENVAEDAFSQETADAVVSRDEWTFGGRVQRAVGRIYFEMPSKNSPGENDWVGYVCSGTVVKDTRSDRSIIITAAHCVYDDSHKAFARNVLFIPNQAAGKSATDTDCSNDVMGCWRTAFGIVETAWAASTFPANQKWDYAFYVVPVTGAHVAGRKGASSSLEKAAGALPIKFEAPTIRGFTYSFGYPYSDDPKLMYCAEPVTRQQGTDWWLPKCELTGGTSGGPWIQPFSKSSGSGPIISVTSWRFDRWKGGLAGAQLATQYTTAKQLFTYAQALPFSSVQDATDGKGGSVRP